MTGQVVGPPNIPGLFEDRSPAHPAPAGLTDRDKTFLHALYSTDQKHLMQRAQVAQRMLRDLKP